MAQSGAERKLNNTIPINPAAIETPEEEGKKKRKKKKGGVVGLIIIILLIAAVGAFLFFSIKYDIAGVRTKLIETVNLLDPDYAKRVELLASIDGRVAAVAKREAKVEEDEIRLNSLRNELSLWQQDLQSKETARIPIYRRMLNDQDLKDMKSLAKTYASMDAADAAAIMVELYSVDDMAAIIYYMSEGSAAKILVEMDTKLAADITMKLLTS